MCVCVCVWNRVGVSRYWAEKPAESEYSRLAVGCQDFSCIFFLLLEFWKLPFCRKRHSFSAGTDFQKFQKWKLR